MVCKFSKMVEANIVVGRSMFESSTDVFYDLMMDDDVNEMLGMQSGRRTLDKACSRIVGLRI